MIVITIKGRPREGVGVGGKTVTAAELRAGVPPP